MALLLLGGCGRRGPDAETKGAGEALATVAPVATPSKRLVYPWSVVAGGVDSGAALRRAAEEDPTVAAHYDGMRLEEFEARRLQADRKGYVSYRVRDRVYWTRRMVTLRAGEEVLTDGRAMIRGRCGNRVSETPQLPVADAGNEPAEAAMDEPVRGAQLLTSPAFPGEATAGPAGPAGPAKPQQPAGEALSVLPAAGNSDALPPVWVNGGTGVLLGGGAPGSSATPTGSTPAPTGGGVAPVPPPGAVIIAQGPPLTGLEIPPPLVSTPLVGPPLVMNPPPGRIPPPGNSPPSHLPPGSLPPGSLPPGTLCRRRFRRCRYRREIRRRRVRCRRQGIRRRVHPHRPTRHCRRPGSRPFRRCRSRGHGCWRQLGWPGSGWGLFSAGCGDRAVSQRPRGGRLRFAGLTWRDGRGREGVTSSRRPGVGPSCGASCGRGWPG
jgi:hypothetical protein